MRKLWWLTGILTVSILFGCDTSEEEQSSTEFQETTDANESIEELPDYDFGGMTLRVGAPHDRTIDPDVNERNERLVERIEMLEEKWNFNYEVVELGWDDPTGQIIRSTLAGEPVADIVHLLSPVLYPSLIDNGLVYPVSDLDIIDYDDPKWSQISKAASEYEGKFYSVTPNAAGLRDAIFWNKTLFDELGLPDLYEIYENGEWTWEKMMEIADQAARDTTNNGEIDLFGFAAESFGSDNLAWKLIYSNGYESIIKTDTGIEIDMSDERVVEALEFYQTVNVDYGHTLRMWEEGDEWFYRYEDFADGSIAMVSAEWWIPGGYWSDGRMQGEYGMIPFPTGPSNDEPVSYGFESEFDVMLATVENPEEKLIIWDAIHDIGTEEDWERWIREDFERYAMDRETVDYALMLNDRTKINLIMGFEQINNSLNDFFGELATGSVSVQSGLESIEPQIQTLLEDFERDGIELNLDEETEEEAEESDDLEEIEE